ncbi:hypothetical protein VTK73DRAFT_2302 [Phialemonium thermophilum]|uniref:Uncharacterized protein n=1 Tax=Phialemonium thermophilum TaxID=223376 RepID=A0ABR3VSC6_9PEZI
MSQAHSPRSRALNRGGTTTKKLSDSVAIVHRARRMSSGGIGPTGLSWFGVQALQDLLSRRSRLPGRRRSQQQGGADRAPPHGGGSLVPERTGESAVRGMVGGLYLNRPACERTRTRDWLTDWQMFETEFQRGPLLIVHAPSVCLVCGEQRCVRSSAGMCRDKEIGARGG